MQTQLRKYKNNLVISGGAIILFQVWSLAKVFISIFIGTSATNGISMTDMINDPSLNPEFQASVKALQNINFTVLAIMIIVILGLCALDISLRIYIGKTAIRIGKGLTLGNRRYIVFATLLLIGSLVGDVFTIYGLTQTSFQLATVMSFVVELTSVYALSDLIRSALKVRKFSRLLTE